MSIIYNLDIFVKVVRYVLNVDLTAMYVVYVEFYYESLIRRSGCSKKIWKMYFFLVVFLICFRLSSLTLYKLVKKASVYYQNLIA